MQTYIKQTHLMYFFIYSFKNCSIYTGICGKYQSKIFFFLCLFFSFGNNFNSINIIIFLLKNVCKFFDENKITKYVLGTFCFQLFGYMRQYMIIRQFLKSIWVYFFSIFEENFNNIFTLFFFWKINRTFLKEKMQRNFQRLFLK